MLQRRNTDCYSKGVAIYKAKVKATCDCTIILLSSQLHVNVVVRRKSTEMQLEDPVVQYAEAPGAAVCPFPA